MSLCHTKAENGRVAILKFATHPNHPVVAPRKFRNQIDILLSVTSGDIDWVIEQYMLIQGYLHVISLESQTSYFKKVFGAPQGQVPQVARQYPTIQLAPHFPHSFC